MSARLLLLCCLALGVFADSPLTSIDLFLGNKEHAIVKLARTGAPDGFVNALLEPKLSVGIIAAAISNVGWDQEGRGALIVKALENRAAKNAALKQNAAFQFAHGYLLGLVNYLDDAVVTRGLENVNQAFGIYEGQHKKRSLAIYTVKTMMEAQTDMAKDWCLIAKKANELRSAVDNAAYDQDLHREALSSAVGYLAEYHSDRCVGVPKPTPIPQAPEAPKKFVTCGKWNVAVQGGNAKTEYYFNLKAGPNSGLAKVVFTSEGYASEANAARGYDAVLKSTKNFFQCNVGNEGAQKGKHYLTIKSPNTQVVGRGEGYATAAGCRKAGFAVMETIHLLASRGITFSKCGPQ